MIQNLLSHLEWLIERSPYYVHAVCLTFDPWLVFGLSLQHLAIWACYLWIAADFAGPAVQRRFPMPRLFEWFIRMCGWTHFTAMLTIWTPYYWISFVVNGVTLLVSIAAAFFWHRFCALMAVLDDENDRLLDETLTKSATVPPASRPVLPRLVYYSLLVLALAAVMVAWVFLQRYSAVMAYDH